MSNLFFPKLRGVGWGTKITPHHFFGTQQARSGRTVRAQFASQPITKISLVYSGGAGGSGYLSDRAPLPADDGSVVFSDYETMLGFFNYHGGGFQSFLFQGATDDDAKQFSRYGEPQFVGDAVTTDFQLVGYRGIWAESIFWPQGLPTVYVGGVQTAVTDLGKGMYRLAVAPAAGVQVTADFVFAYRVTFDGEELEFENWRDGYWKCDTPMTTIKP